MLFLTVICHQPYPIAEEMDTDVAIRMFFHMLKRIGDGVSFLFGAIKNKSQPGGKGVKGEYVPDVRDSLEVIRDAIIKAKKKKKRRKRARDKDEGTNIFKRIIKKNKK